MGGARNAGASWLVAAMLVIGSRAGGGLLAVAAVCAVGALAAPRAHAAWTFDLGIGEQGTAMFADPRFAALRLKHVRLVVPYDVACRRGAARQYVDAWLAAAEGAGARPLVGFSSSWQRPRTELPSYRAFLRCFRAFRARWPRVVDFNPWNEVNHWYQPTYRHPRRAAGFYNAARRACPRCNVAAGDLLDSGNLARWLARYRRHLRGRPRLWSMHNYLDVNYLRPWRRSGTRRMLRVTRGRLWISETAGIVYYIRAGRLGERHAARATRWMLALPTRSHRIKRVYAYQWQAPCHPDTWDSAWFRSDGSSRPSYRELVAELARRRRLDPTAAAALDPPLWPGVHDTCAGEPPRRRPRPRSPRPSAALAVAPTEATL